MTHAFFNINNNHLASLMKKTSKNVLTLCNCPVDLKSVQFSMLEVQTQTHCESEYV